MSAFLLEKLNGGAYRPELLITLLRALGSCGDIKAVEVIYKLLHAEKLHPHVQTQARQAVARIEERLDGQGEGWLSLAAIGQQRWFPDFDNAGAGSSGSESGGPGARGSATG